MILFIFEITGIILFLIIFSRKGAKAQGRQNKSKNNRFHLCQNSLAGLFVLLIEIVLI